MRDAKDSSIKDVVVLLLKSALAVQLFIINKWLIPQLFFFFFYLTNICFNLFLLYEGGKKCFHKLLLHLRCNLQQKGRNSTNNFKIEAKNCFVAPLPSHQLIIFEILHQSPGVGIFFAVRSMQMQMQNKL